MARREIRFDTGFESWLDTTLDKIRRETGSKLKGNNTAEGVQTNASHRLINDSKSYSTFSEDSRNNNHTEAGSSEGFFGPQVLADDLAAFEYELIDDAWEEIATGVTHGERRTNMASRQREGVREGFQAGGQFYTTVWGLEDDDDERRDSNSNTDYPQTPSTRERVAKILQETELTADSSHSTSHSSPKQRPRREFRFDSVNYKAVKDASPEADSWSLEDEPAVTLDPSRLPYLHRGAGDGKEQQPEVREMTTYLAGDDQRDSQLSGSLEEFEDAHETLEEMGNEEIDIKTPKGKGRALLPMEDLELSFEDESDENILDVEEEYGGGGGGGGSVTIRPVEISDTEPIIMDGGQLRELAQKRRRKVRICIFVTLGVLMAGAFSLVTYLTVHLLG